MKIDIDPSEIPPNLPFLKFEGIAGRGGMAVVWRAWHKELERYVAVKVMDRAFATSGQDVRQFMMEVRTMTDLHHPGIIQGYGADFVDGSYYFIMDYVDGYTFGSLLKRKTRLPCQRSTSRPPTHRLRLSQKNRSRSPRQVASYCFITVG